ncbi:MAG: cyclopropane fatty acyl phospholipid synthase [Gammaproteobacteria bacterium]|nr:cyclopropane fatty acyl phospholipid synthase [Gammaproteobacteria bacterium]
MAYARYRKRFEELMSSADIQVNGDRPWDMQVHRNETFPRFFAFGSLGMGESYMDGWWDCEQLDEFINRLASADLKSMLRPTDLLLSLQARLLSPKGDSSYDGEGARHYDLGRELYNRMLDKRMIYSCAYWRGAESLDEAQEQKLNLIARKLQLEPGMKVLDIGCGWGGAIHYFAEYYGIEGVAVTLSKDQHDAATELCANLPVEVRLQDFRKVDEKFDRSYSIDMLGHLGNKDYRKYMEVVKRNLHPGGLHLVQTAGSENSTAKSDPWVNRYIFPGGNIPSPKQIINAAESLLVLDDWHTFTQDYDRTFMCWNANLEAARKDLHDLYDDRMLRMWRYYLLSFAGVFRSGMSQLWQIVFSEMRSGPNLGHIR